MNHINIVVATGCVARIIVGNEEPTSLEQEADSREFGLIAYSNMFDLCLYSVPDALACARQSYLIAISVASSFLSIRDGSGTDSSGELRGVERR